ncbi:hypothetical protein RJ641_007295 [Dillenia turbinata]|uniref:Uncharacterized protein n=1 Tax=Dillenia turbinata TaxID=194707 RepID=A0AAN8Z5H1_9MAGN
MDLEEVPNGSGGDVPVAVAVDEKSDGSGGEKRMGMYLVWQELTVVLSNIGKNGEARRLLDGLNGFSEPGRIMAIMGPSGSGKLGKVFNEKNVLIY